MRPVSQHLLGLLDANLNRAFVSGSQQVFTVMDLTRGKQATFHSEPTTTRYKEQCA